MTHESARLEEENSKQFSELNISAELKKGIKDLGYVTPTDFQKGVFDNFNKGKHVVGEGQSSYGKNLAFSLPILAKVDPKNEALQALIICENPMQSDLCAKECRALGRHLGINVSTTASAQGRSAEPVPHILVVSMDDAEKMDTERLLSSLHTVFFDGLSADHAKRALKLLKTALNPNIQILIFGTDTASAFRDNGNGLIDDAIFISNNDQPKISLPAKHIFFQAKEAEPKPKALLGAIEALRPRSSLITCNEAQECDLLARFLSRYGYKTKAISEDLDRNGFEDALKELLSHQIDVLVCQISLLNSVSLENVPYMFNYDMFDRPQTYEQTTQFNKQAAGLQRSIISLLTSRELGFLGPIKAQCLIDFSEMPIPPEDEIMNLCTKRIRDSLNQAAREVELGQFEILTKKIVDDHEALPGLSLLLRNHLLALSAKSVGEPRESERDRERRPHPTDRHRRFDRRERDVRGSNDSFLANNPNEREAISSPKGEGITRLYVTLGRRDGLFDLASLAQYLSDKSGVDLGHFSGSGMIRDTSAHIEVDDDVADDIIKALNNSPRPEQAESDIKSEEPAAPALVVCERARQTTQRPHHRRPPQRRRPFQKR